MPLEEGAKPSPVVWGVVWTSLLQLPAPRPLSGAHGAPESSQEDSHPVLGSRSRRLGAAALRRLLSVGLEGWGLQSAGPGPLLSFVLTCAGDTSVFVSCLKTPDAHRTGTKSLLLDFKTLPS